MFKSQNLALQEVLILFYICSLIMVVYYKGLDGLRAYSVILVMLFHAEILWWGWIGVHIFFVLSGFLITGILLKAKERPDYYRNFYVRRILRIFPLYFLLLTIIFISAIAFKVSVKDGYLYVLYLQNYKLGFTNFNVNFPHPFDHTWSLAVEEQFYLVFPFIIYIFSTATLKRIFLGMIALGILTLVLSPYRYPGSDINWTNTVTNFIFLGSGAFIATLKKGNYAQAKIFLIMLSVVFFIVYIKMFNLVPVKLTHVNGQLFLIMATPAISFLLLHLIGTPNAVSRFLFYNRIAVYIGKISYGIYLFHIPVFFAADQFHLPLLFKFASTIGLAAISWHFFESKFLSLKERFTYKTTEMAVAH